MNNVERLKPEEAAEMCPEPAPAAILHLAWTFEVLAAAPITASAGVLSGQDHQQRMPRGLAWFPRSICTAKEYHLISPVFLCVARN